MTNGDVLAAVGCLVLWLVIMLVVGTVVDVRRERRWSASELRRPAPYDWASEYDEVRLSPERRV